jgi:spermidine synthase
VLSVTTDLYTMRYIKQRTETYSDYAAWNAFSRVSAFKTDRNAAQILPLKNHPDTYVDGYPPTMILDIDGAAWTPMMGWDGDPASIQFLRDTVLYAAHAVRPNARVLVIGTGGGRDLLAAVAYGQPSILGIEINPLMRHLVEEHYGDYTGHPYSSHGVEVIVDEARSRLSSVDRIFDIIQLSLIDTFSLNAAGGFVFSENYLYTVEGFQEYFEHLSDDGILSLTRYFVPAYPLEILRLVGMARAAWEDQGVTRFQDHVVILLQGMNSSMLVKKTPYTEAEMTTLKAEAARMGVQVLYAPWDTTSGHADITKLMTADDWRGYIETYPFLIHPPTDDRPFFFNFLRGLVPKGIDDPFKFLNMWNDALVLMYMLIGTVTVIATVFFLLPLVTFGSRPHRIQASVAAPMLLYFACLGYGFLMVEIPLLQRFVLFLGYPVYALAVVLFAILLFSGIGSLLSSRITAPPRTALLTVLAAIVVVSLAYLVLVPRVSAALLTVPISLRIATTVALLAPLGLLLGMAYPLGITVLRGYGEELVPWAWSLNGVMSVVASVVAAFIGSRIGFSAAFLTGVGAYALGFAAMAFATSRAQEAPMATEPARRAAAS